MQGVSISQVGLVRENNEDVVCCRPSEGIFMVADGMGGEACGEVASAMAVQTVLETLRTEAKSEYGKDEILRSCVLQANDMIYRKSISEEKYSGMGTTLTLLWCQGDMGYIAHVGDSRAYLYRDGHLRQLTQDHSLVAEMLRHGEITPAEALTHPQRNVITRALGTFKRVDVDILYFKLLPGDAFLLCSDGLSNQVSAEEIAAAFRDTPQLERIVSSLADLAMARGGKDNISAVAVYND